MWKFPLSVDSKAVEYVFGAQVVSGGDGCAREKGSSKELTAVSLWELSKGTLTNKPDHRAVDDGK